MTNNKELLDWARKHKENIETRNAILKIIGVFLLWLGLSIGNYYLLNAATITTLANGIMAFGFELSLLMLWSMFILKLMHKKLNTFAVALAFAAVATFAVATLATFAVALAVATSAVALAVALAFAFAFAFAEGDDN